LRATPEVRTRDNPLTRQACNQIFAHSRIAEDPILRLTVLRE